jgi:hypothetical protein
LVKPFRRTEEYGAGFAGVVTHADDVIEALALELIDVL